MMKISAFLTMILCASVAFGQALPNVPQTLLAAYTSTTGLANSWLPMLGSGAATIPNVPTPAGLYCSNDGTGNAGTWVPCASLTTQVTAAAGSAGTPSITSSVDTTTGFHFPAAGQTAYSAGGFDQWIAASGVIEFRNTVAFKWSSGAPSTSNDTGIQRVSAGIIQLNNGTASTGGALQIPALKSTTGTRFVCVDTSGNLTSSATACSGT